MNYKRVFIENGLVHIVLVAYKRKKIFIENISLLRKAFANAKKFFGFEIIAICVLPDHIYMILKPQNIYDYPKIVTSIKYYFSKNYNVGVETPTYGYNNKKEKGIWQRRFYEHTIRDEEDLNKHIDYIHYNSYKHFGIIPKDWEFSTFSKFVKDGYYEQNWLVDDKIFKDIDCE